jgi:hypothetical protein
MKPFMLQPGVPGSIWCVDIFKYEFYFAVSGCVIVERILIPSVKKQQPTQMIAASAFGKYYVAKKHQILSGNNPGYFCNLTNKY